MATTPAKTQTFSPDELAELLSLIKKSDSVELKATVPESHHRSTVDALGMDPLDAQIRQVFFFDTPDLGWTSRAWSSAPAASRARTPTRPSSSGRSSRRSCRTTCAGRRASASRSTLCPAASSAPGP